MVKKSWGRAGLYCLATDTLALAWGGSGEILAWFVINLNCKYS